MCLCRVAFLLSEIFASKEEIFKGYLQSQPKVFEDYVEIDPEITLSSDFYVAKSKNFIKFGKRFAIIIRKGENYVVQYGTIRRDKKGKIIPTISNAVEHPEASAL